MSFFRILVILFGFLGICSCDFNDGRDLIVGISADYPPYEYMGSANEYDGIDVEVVRFIANQMGRRFEIRNMEFSGIVPALKTDSVDFAISAFSRTEDREREIDFSKVYWTARLSIVFNKKLRDVGGIITDGKIDPVKISGKFGVQSGSTMEIYIQSLVEEQGRDDFSVTSYSNVMSMISLLKDGRLDFVIMDSLPAKIIAKKNHEDIGCFELVDPKFDFVIAFPKGSKIVREVNNAIDLLISSGELKRIERTVIKDLEF